jgi:hypothetical protein
MLAWHQHSSKPGPHSQLQHIFIAQKSGTVPDIPGQLATMMNNLPPCHSNVGLAPALQQAWSSFSTAAYFHCPGRCQAVLAKIGMYIPFSLISDIATTH